jgi:hypothetical protein
VCTISGTETLVLFFIHSGIPPGDAFTYDFTVTEQTGTYWVHGHYSVSCIFALSGGAHSENIFRDNTWMDFVHRSLFTTSQRSINTTMNIPSSLATGMHHPIAALLCLNSIKVPRPTFCTSRLVYESRQSKWRGTYSPFVVLCTARLFR